MINHLFNSQLLTQPIQDQQKSPITTNIFNENVTNKVETLHYDLYKSSKC